MAFFAVAGPMPGRSCSVRKRGDGVARVLRPAQDRQHVLDVRGLDEFEPAVFDERDVAPGQLDFEQRAVVRGAEQHRLAAQIDPGLAVVEHAIGDIGGLRRLVGRGDEARQLGRGAGRDQRLGDALAGARDHRVGGGEDRLGRAIVVLERDDGGGR